MMFTTNGFKYCRNFLLGPSRGFNDFEKLAIENKQKTDSGFYNVAPLTEKNRINFHQN